MVRRGGCRNYLETKGESSGHEVRQARVLGIHSESHKNWGTTSGLLGLLGELPCSQALGYPSKAHLVLPAAPIHHTSMLTHCVLVRVGREVEGPAIVWFV